MSVMRNAVLQVHVCDGHFTVGVFLCVLFKTISRKSDAVGTGAMAFMPFVADIVSVVSVTERLSGELLPAKFLPMGVIQFFPRYSDQRGAHTPTGTLLFNLS